MRSLAFLLILLFQTQNIGLRMISVKTEAEARDLRARTQKGESFEELARKYSADSTGPAGGYLGTFALSDLRKEFQDGLAGLRPGDVGGEFRRPPAIEFRLPSRDVYFGQQCCHHAPGPRGVRAHAFRVPPLVAVRPARAPSCRFPPRPRARAPKARPPLARGSPRATVARSRAR